MSANGGAEDRRLLHEALSSNPLEPLTVESIEDNPWLAVVHVLEASADAEVILAAASAADAMIDQATRWANGAADPADEEQWLDLLRLAEERVERCAELSQAAAMREASIYERYPDLTRDDGGAAASLDEDMPGRGR
jgi:hypothetical protein